MIKPKAIIVRDMCFAMNDLLPQQYIAQLAEIDARYRQQTVKFLQRIFKKMSILFCKTLTKVL